MVATLAVLDDTAPDLLVLDDAATVLFVFADSPGYDPGAIVHQSMVSGPLVVDVGGFGAIFVHCWPVAGVEVA
jgi:hypothetical protein